MIDDKVQTSWKRFTDQVKGLWSDHYEPRGNEIAKTPVQPITEEGTLLPQSTTQTSRANLGT
jgi:hypothetical protein